MVNSNDDIPVGKIPPFGLRLRPDLKKRISEAAKENGRSENSEIVARLEQSFRQSYASQTDVDQLRDEVRQLGARLWSLEKKTG